MDDSSYAYLVRHSNSRADHHLELLLALVWLAAEAAGSGSAYLSYIYSRNVSVTSGFLRRLRNARRDLDLRTTG